MRRQTQRQWIFITQLLIIAGLSAATIWNLAGLWFELTQFGWWLLAAWLLAGLLAWTGAMLAPLVLLKTRPPHHYSYRLLYDAPADWSDEGARLALLNLIRSGTGVSLTWAREGTDVGCWLSVPERSELLERLVRDIFPAGVLELDSAPRPDRGMVILEFKPEEKIPGPADICELPGVAGVYYRWHSETAATVTIWGQAALEVVRKFAGRSALLEGRAETWQRPPYLGHNPWPGLPPFPSSQNNPGLAAVSRFRQLAPALRLPEPNTALVIGTDAQQYPLGFGLPDLAGMQPLRVYGQLAETVSVSLAHQAIQAGLPVAFLDGRGTAVARLVRQLMRELAAGQILICDVERPAQSRFRLNPLWLPQDQDVWPRIFGTGWLTWLRELGVTPAGLGRLAYQHTQLAVILSALVAVQRGLALDVPGLQAALASPDFLTMVGQDHLPAPNILDDRVWDWWLTEGRTTPSFDVHLRLGHLHNRLAALLNLSQYRLLWQPPYLEPLPALTVGTSLLWRVPDPHHRLGAFVSSHLLALTSLLSAWPPEQPPLLIFLHELEGGDWVNQLKTFASARLILSAEKVTSSPILSGSTSLLLSRLEREAADTVAAELPQVTAADLRRLPPTRLIFLKDQQLATLDIQD